MNNLKVRATAQRVVDHFCKREKLPPIPVSEVSQVALMYGLVLDVRNNAQTLSIFWLEEDSLEQEIMNGLEKYRKTLCELANN